MNPFQSLYERWLAWQGERQAEAQREPTAHERHVERVVQQQRETRDKELRTLTLLYPEDYAEDLENESARRGRVRWRGKAERWR